ncbi:hypothetical protein ACN469_26765 [Corallococcus terminator]
MLLAGMTAGALVACKSTPHKPDRESKALIVHQQCDNKAISSSAPPTILVDCTGFLSGTNAICGEPGQEVTFITTCHHSVQISFSDAATLFVGAHSTVNVHPGPKVNTLTLQGKSGDHWMCIGSGDCGGTSGDHLMCMGSDDCDVNVPSTGSLDVATSGDGGDKGREK